MFSVETNVAALGRYGRAGGNLNGRETAHDMKERPAAQRASQKIPKLLEFPWFCHRFFSTDVVF